MVRMSVAATALVVFCLIACVPGASAQQSLSGIAGSVKDEGGRPVVGVTVEAASEALIEKVRSVITDAQGQYKILDLVVGSYVVSFKASGFRTLRQEGVELTSGVTATVNGTLTPGTAEAVVTIATLVTVDTQNTRQQQILSDALLDALPTSTKNLASVSQTNAAVNAGNTSDVGGSGGLYLGQGNSSQYHGKTGIKRLYDGLGVENAEGTGNTGIMINSLYTAEVVTEIGGGNAEAISSGAIMNNIPKSGSNNYALNFSGLYSGEGTESENLDDALRSKGLTSSSKVVRLYDDGLFVGGPVKKDRAWFFLSERYWGQTATKAGVYWNCTQGTVFYTPCDGTNGRPYHRGIKQEYFRSHAGRLNYLASSRIKISMLVDVQNNQKGYSGSGENVAVEADTVERFWPQALTQLTVTAPVTGKLLLTGGLSWHISHWPTTRSGTGSPVGPNDFPINDSGTGLLYGTATTNTDMRPPWMGQSCWYGCRGIADSDRLAQRVGISYITGTHAFKVGFGTEQIYNNKFAYVPGTPDLRIGPANVASVQYTLNNGVPSAIVENAGPNLIGNYTHELGIFAQDQWTIKKLTLNLGLRYDQFKGYAAPTPLNVTNFGPARAFPEVDNIPNWKDINPRVGASYDLFGNGKTALKATVGRFVSVQGVGIPAANNPYSASGTTTTRTWTDANTNFYPDCDLHNPAANGECGALANSTFGQGTPITRYSDEVLLGWGARDYTWDSSFEVVHAFSPTITGNFGYYRNQFYNFTTTNNTSVTPNDYQSYCIPAPSDPRLPGGGGYKVCGLYDVVPSRFGQTTNVVQFSKDFGTQTRVNDFFGGNLNAKLPRNARLGLSVDVGRTVTDNCFIVNSPQQLFETVGPDAARYCHQTIPWGGNLNIRLNGTYQLPFEIALSPNYQNGPGPQIVANYTVPTSVVSQSLGRNLAACGTRTTCSATVSVPLILPGSLFGDRKNQLDVRLSRSFKVGRKLRIQGKFDAYNLLNANWIQSQNATYSANAAANKWLTPLTIMNGRLLQFSTTVNF
jgi:hypothetical protein